MRLDIDPNSRHKAPAISHGPEGFFPEVLEALTGTLEEVIGEENASGITARVGNQVGENLEERYAKALGRKPQSLAEIANILVDVEVKIGGDLSVVSVDDNQITLSACQCPFTKGVADRPSLCIMVINIIGRITANAMGYASVRVERSMSLGHPECLVVVSLNRNHEDEAYEFFG